MKEPAGSAVSPFQTIAPFIFHPAGTEAVPAGHFIAGSGTATG